MLAAVLFDFNGVLVDDEALHLRGFNEVLAPLGIAIDPREYEERYLGFDDRGAFAAVLAERGHAPDPVRVARLIAAKSAVYARLAARELRVFAGAAALVRAAAARVPVAIVSGALRVEIEGALDVLGVRGCVRVIVAAEDVAACKPDPEGYRAALRALDPALDPARAVAVEDSAAGVISARAAGTRVVAVAHTYPAEVLMGAGADMVRETIATLAFRDLEAVAGVMPRGGYRSQRR